MAGGLRVGAALHGTLARLVGLAYPAGDIVVIAIGAQAAMRVRWSPSGLVFLGGMALLFYLATMVRLGPNVFNRPM